jgi:hypothetical protein
LVSAYAIPFLSPFRPRSMHSILSRQMGLHLIYQDNIHSLHLVDSMDIPAAKYRPKLQHDRILGENNGRSSANGHSRPSQMEDMIQGFQSCAPGSFGMPQFLGEKWALTVGTAAVNTNISMSSLISKTRTHHYSTRASSQYLQQRLTTPTFSLRLSSTSRDKFSNSSCQRNQSTNMSGYGHVAPVDTEA